MTSASNYIFIEDLELQASVGIYDHEKRDRQPLLISLTLECLRNETFQSDNIQDTINYEEIIQLIHTTVNERHYNLIESLAEKIASDTLKIQSIHRITIEIRKPSVLGAKSGGMLGIKIERHL